MLSLVFADLVNREDIRMVECRRGFGFLNEPIQKAFVFAISCWRSDDLCPDLGLTLTC